MKYYVYISDAKVDMLLSQIPKEGKGKIATEFKLDFKLLSMSRKRETENEDNRIARLEAVCSFIREYGDVGSCNEPGEYFQGTLPMVMGPDSVRIDPYFVYFAGQTGRTVLGLGGSTLHLIGNHEKPSGHLVPSTLKGLIRAVNQIDPELNLQIKQRLQQSYELDRRNVDSDIHRIVNPTRISHRSNKEIPGDIFRATREMLRNGIVQRYEFLAKRLLYKDLKLSSGKWKLLLGTPLYVAA